MVTDLVKNEAAMLFVRFVMFMYGVLFNKILFTWRVCVCVNSRMDPILYVIVIVSLFAVQGGGLCKKKSCAPRKKKKKETFLVLLTCICLWGP